MSIIYDALNKTQEIRNKAPKTKKSTPSYYRLGFFVGLALIFILLPIAALLSYPHYKQYMKPIKPIALKTIAKTLSPPKKYYILNGIFLSDTEQVAVINNIHYRLGDKVEGMDIVDIKENLVKLKDQSHTLVLAMIH